MTEYLIKKNEYINSLRVENNEMYKLQILKRNFEKGFIEEKDMTKEQINALCNLYKQENMKLSRSNTLLKKRLLTKMK